MVQIHWFNHLLRRERVATLLLAVVVGCFVTIPTAQAADSGEGMVHGNDSRALLVKRLNDLQTFHAHFSQFIEGARGDVIEESTGEIVMQRPRLRWEVDAPYPQIIVADDRQLQIYDPDLAQMMVRPITSALGDTPIALLTQEQVSLSDQFEVVYLPGDGVSAEDVFLLTPLTEDSLFQEVRLHFEATQLTQLLIYDHLGQYTTVRFRQIPLKGVLDSSVFELDLPEDVDIIEG